jgi:hypothetical protein
MVLFESVSDGAPLKAQPADRSLGRMQAGLPLRTVPAEAAQANSAGRGLSLIPEPRVKCLRKTTVNTCRIVGCFA